MPQGRLYGVLCLRRGSLGGVPHWLIKGTIWGLISKEYISIGMRSFGNTKAKP